VYLENKNQGLDLHELPAARVPSGYSLRFLGLYAEKLDPRKPKILIPLILVGVLIVVAAILTQKPWWDEFLQALGSLVS